MCVLQKVGFWKRSMREQFEAETMRRGVVTEELLESPRSRRWITYIVVDPGARGVTRFSSLISALTFEISTFAVTQGRGVGATYSTQGKAVPAYLAQALWRPHERSIIFSAVFYPVCGPGLLQHR
jgi:hypothetical protein